MIPPHRLLLSLNPPLLYVIWGRGSGKGALRSHVGLRGGAAECGGREQDRLITPPLADERIYGSKAAVFGGYRAPYLSHNPPADLRTKLAQLGFHDGESVPGRCQW